MLATSQAAPDAALVELKREIMYVGQALAQCGFHAALAGNISARLGDDRLVCTCAGADKGVLEDGHLVVCDMEGELVQGTTRPTSELLMHLAVYRARSDVRAVIHAHPPMATAFAAASEPLDKLSLPEMLVWLGPVALVPYGTPGTPELAARLQPYLKDHDGFLLENHGALSVGKSLRQAAQRMELIEQNACITLMVRQLGKQPFALTAEQLDGLMALRSRLTAMQS
jgi:L-fuculose-phosphate aldolase